MASRVAILGGSAGAARAALTLAEMGIEVAVITQSAALGLDSADNGDSISSLEKTPTLWPLLLRAASHPLVTMHTNSEVTAISGRQGRFTVRVSTHPRYVRRDMCTSCGRCEEECSVKVISLLDGEKVTHSAIHAPVPGGKTVPSAFYIEKNGIAPCRVACPLGINVQGFVSLLSKGKVDEALGLIHEAAPLAGVLGRVCTHPCENGCKRVEVDSPVFIQSLHRYAADNAPGGIKYSRKAPAGSRREKIAIVGSGPAGLVAAWELARRGYNPTIFESHGVVGGMLATGIPRFRLPHEVREREVAAIRAMGVDIRTGVTVGRDVSIADLRERGYRAFFLAIGAHENRRLNIPSENLDGVVDSMSLLFALNLKFGASVGSNVVVIGGGNSAIDSARTAKRRSKGVVSILYRRTAEEMTAVEEEVEEAIKEGISIEYLVAPVEILGDGTKVTGIRCQRMALGEVGADGRRRPEPIPGSEYVIEADHVVIAIGQKPNTPILNLKRLEVDPDDATVNVDPLTLETNRQGIFAGGDCVTGPSNVVDAAASGLRAAASIDRYLRGRSLTKGRSLDKPQPVDVDVNERHASYFKRSRMPALPHSRRKGSFEEVNLGLPNDVSEREAGRCLNCALCSECMECERVCELNAVFHRDSEEHVEVSAEVILDFTAAADGTGEALPVHTLAAQPHAGIYTIEMDEDAGVEGELATASSAALTAAAELIPKGAAQPQSRGNAVIADSQLKPQPGREEAGAAREARIGVTLCQCGGSISSVVDFEESAAVLRKIPGVVSVVSIPQACNREGADSIAAQAADSKLDRMVLAACRCCGLEQICFSCTERRVLCQLNLSQGLDSSHGVPMEFINIREQCAKVHRDEPADATRVAIDVIASGVARAMGPLPQSQDERPIEEGVLILGAGLRGLAAAKAVKTQGYSVALISGPRPDGFKEQQDRELQESRDALVKSLEAQGIHAMPWPRDLALDGSPGSFVAVAKTGSQADRIKAGALIIDLGEQAGEILPSAGDIPEDSFLGRILARGTNPESIAGAGSSELRGVTIRETAGIFIMPPDEEETAPVRITKGSASAARAVVYLGRGVVSPRGTAVSIDARRCRGCGECAAVCSFIELKGRDNGPAYACVDEALCLGCGACVARCPTGAISQAVQSYEQLASTLEALLGRYSGAVGAK